MQTRNAILTLIDAVDDSIQKFESLTPSGIRGLHSILLRRRRAFVMLRATLRRTPPSRPALRSPALWSHDASAAPTPSMLMKAERRLIDLYTTTLAQIGQNTPEASLLRDQRAECEQAYLMLSDAAHSGLNGSVQSTGPGNERRR